MSMKHPGRHHGKAAQLRRLKQQKLKEEKRALRARLAEAQKASA